MLHNIFIVNGPAFFGPARFTTYNFPQFRLPDLPYVPGSDAAGYIEDIGSSVGSLFVGQRVFVTGKNSGAVSRE